MATAGSSLADVFEQLEFVKRRIAEAPDRYSQTDPDIIFNMLESGTNVGTVLRNIQKVNGLKRRRSDSSDSESDVMVLESEELVVQLGKMFPDWTQKSIRAKINNNPGATLPELVNLVLDNGSDFEVIELDISPTTSPTATSKLSKPTPGPSSKTGAGPPSKKLKFRSPPTTTGTSSELLPGPSSTPKPGSSSTPRPGPSSTSRPGPSSTPKPGPSTEPIPGPSTEKPRNRGLKHYKEREEQVDTLKAQKADLTMDTQIISQTGDGPADRVADAAAVETVAETVKILSNIFPNAALDYIEKTALEIGRDNEKLQEFVDRHVEKSSSMPTRKEYESRLASQRQEREVRELTVRDFLREYENPLEHFMNIDLPVSHNYQEWCRYYLLKKFQTKVHKIKAILKANKFHFLPALKEVLAQDRKPTKGKQRAPRRVQGELRPPQKMDLYFLKEFVYSKLEDKVRTVMEAEAKFRMEAVEKAREKGELFECECCGDSDCLPEEACECEAGHMFCRLCVRRGTAVEVGKNKSRIACYAANCDKEFPVKVLEGVLDRKLMQRIHTRRQAEEISAANIEGLECCPACDYAVIIPNNNDKILKCNNPDCGKETCRLCKEENHIPLGCDEVEKSDETRLRTQVEAAMAEAVIRECPDCGNRFTKIEGCNKMTCPCGTKMCYLCRKKISRGGYSHFNGEGASPDPKKCKLYTSSAEDLHRAEAARAAADAKKKLNVGHLKNDPTANLQPEQDNLREGDQMNFMVDWRVMEEERPRRNNGGRQGGNGRRRNFIGHLEADLGNVARFFMDGEVVGFNQDWARRRPEAVLEEDYGNQALFNDEDNRMLAPHQVWRVDGGWRRNVNVWGLWNGENDMDPDQDPLGREMEIDNLFDDSDNEYRPNGF